MRPFKYKGLMDLDHAYPAISDLRARAKRRVPRYIWEYLDSATGSEAAWHRAEAAMDAVTLMPGVLSGELAPDLETALLGRSYARPFGIAPVGMSGAVWPGAEAMLASMAADHGIPWCMSTVSPATPEDVAPVIGESGWFQLYPPKDPDMRRDILARARDAGFHTLVFTVDVPVLSRRERERRVNLKNPMKMSPTILAQSVLAPAWAWGMVGRSPPRPRLFDKYVPTGAVGQGHKHIGLELRCVPDWNYLDALRGEWDGPLVIKGILDPETVPRLLSAGADALWVSNHGGRQFEPAPAPLTQLPSIRDAAGADVPLIYDGAVRSGTDVLRALAQGADFVMLGRAFHYGLAALGARGAAHVTHLLTEQMKCDMAQMGINRPREARDCRMA